MTVKVPQKINLVQKISTTWNQQISECVFSKVIEYEENQTDEWIQNIRNKIDHKKSSNIKQIRNTIPNIRIKVWKCKAVKFLRIKIGKVSICSFYFYLFLLSQYYI